ncbi:E3 ubiquitin-protein ligase TRIM23-like [Myiozetetes cayanensis]|uniref:E3 ubiquitin-protein ligase TRIM23-like n=1 Tax=Myiozetetes cayanensis TaxID=478635 RepID=UPI00215F9738|nr:E3 ubiquitin-protein ligase TRIM23-like [Myiozetetes cayanensis]
MAALAVNRPGAGAGPDGGRGPGSGGGRGPAGAAVKVLECGVCEDVFSLQGDKVPRLLLCGHTVCHDCLTRLPLHGRAVRCPFDRQVTELVYSLEYTDLGLCVSNAICTREGFHHGTFNYRVD